MTFSNFSGVLEAALSTLAAHPPVNAAGVPTDGPAEIEDAVGLERSSGFDDGRLEADEDYEEDEEVGEDEDENLGEGFGMDYEESLQDSTYREKHNFFRE